MLQELAANSDHGSALRGVLKKIMKAVPPNEINAVGLCKAMMEHRPEMDHDLALTQPWLARLVDLVAAAVLYAMPPQLYDPAPPKDLTPILKDFQNKVADIQMEALRWCHEVMGRYNVNLTQAMKKLLFLENPNAYLVPGDPSADVEKGMLRNLTLSMPVHEDTLIRVVLMPLHNLPVTTSDALDILEGVVKRAALQSIKSPPGLEVANPQLANAILRLPAYPPHPDLLISALYWQVLSSQQQPQQQLLMSVLFRHVSYC